MTDELRDLTEGLIGIRQQGTDAHAHFMRYVDILSRKAEAARSAPEYSSRRTEVKALCRHLQYCVRRFAELLEDRLYWQRRWVAAAQERAAERDGKGA